MFVNTDIRSRERLVVVVFTSTRDEIMRSSRSQIYIYMCLSSLMVYSRHDSRHEMRSSRSQICIYICLSTLMVYSRHDSRYEMRSSRSQIYIYICLSSLMVDSRHDSRHEMRSSRSQIYIYMCLSSLMIYSRLNLRSFDSWICIWLSPLRFYFGPFWRCVIGAVL